MFHNETHFSTSHYMSVRLGLGAVKIYAQIYLQAPAE